MKRRLEGKVGKITILLANDQHMVRQSIRLLLEGEADFEVVGEVDNAPDAVRLTREFKPDIIIIETRMPGLSGVEAIKRVKAEHRQGAVLILTMEEDEEYIAELLAAGAASYLLETADSEKLFQTIRSLRAREVI